MPKDGFESRVKVQQIIDSQLPEFILDENPKAAEFLKQYYISQEYQGGTTDITENLDQYLKLDNFTPEVIVGETNLHFAGISSSTKTIQVDSTKGFPPNYGLLKIDDEIITYTGITTNTFTGCIRGFSGVTAYHQELNQQELVFSTSNSSAHVGLSTVTNLSSLFLQEFYKKTKYSLTPGLEDFDFTSNLNVGNFIKESSSLYKSKGTDESFRILFNVLYNETPKIVNLENFLIKPSSASYLRRKVAIAEVISGDPLGLRGQTIIKSNDFTTTASVSEVEVIRRRDKTYYKLLLFLGYDDSFPTITGSFDITGSTKNLNYVGAGSSVITVDSTIGFPLSGKVFSGTNSITYTDKNINQFLGCFGITAGIATASTIYSQDTYYGYENGDTTKKVELRITGVLSDFNTINQVSSTNEGEYIFVKNIGELIKNPDSNPTKKQIFANSWIYNTSTRYQIDEFIDPNNDGSINQFSLKSSIDKSSLKVGDFIDILSRNSELSYVKNLQITQISDNIVTTNNFFTINQSFRYDIRRRIKTSSSSSVPLEYSESFADVQNVYNENDEYMYVASNSLPSYNINVSPFSYNASGLDGLDDDTGLYSRIIFPSQVSFITGSEIYYKPSNSPISGLSEGLYYVEVLAGINSIRLYSSRSVIGSVNYLQFSNFPSGTHNFTILEQKEKVISPQKIFKKFSLEPSISKKGTDATEVGPVGLLINGVEVLSYKSDNKIYYGPLNSVKVLNGGGNYDVINPPLLTVDFGSATIQPVIRGSLEKIYVDPQDFDIDTIVSIALTGGNGKGSSIEPVVERKSREIDFDAKELGYGGGVDVNAETITFKTQHGLIDGQTIFYNPQNNPSLGIGTFQGSNFITGLTLEKNTQYTAKFINDRTIQLYRSFSDYNSGINTVGFTTIGTSGIHKFYTTPKNTLTQVKVINGGQFENRKLRVLPVGISTLDDTVYFKNHGFNDGELISYDYQTTSISGLSTSNQYYILKVDNDYFKLSNAGIGGTYKTNYDRGKTVRFLSTGSGYQIFKYPDISLSIQYSSIGIGTTQAKGSILATPVIRGTIIDAYVYEKGSDYGSNILNYHKKPTIQIKNGSKSQINPVIVDGKITDVSILYGGEDYYSLPDLKVTGIGTGAILRPVITNNKISRVVVINPGYGYSTSNTSITVESAGKNAIFDPEVRSISVNNNNFYTNINDTSLQNAGEIISSSKKNLQYSICGYPGKIQTLFNDNINSHSPIIGWAYDGNPIYGSYGYSNPKDKNSAIVRLRSGYTLNTNNVFNRPSGFAPGFFIEDYKFTNSGDLDEYNGRFCITPEFPDGTYAYFATSVLDVNGNIIGQFPYFIGEKYRSSFISENKKLTQDFNFNKSKLVRNTFPYNLSQKYANNDFIIESNELVNQSFVIESVEKGSIDGFNIISSGSNYKVNDVLVFDETNTGGSGLSAKVSEIEGKQIENIQTTSSQYNNAIFTWKNGEEVDVTISQSHSLNNLDNVTISGFSTELSSINGSYQIGFTTYTSTLVENLSAYASTGIVTDIYVSNVPSSISIGSSIKIDNEILSILNLFRNENVIRVIRDPVGTSHTATSPIYFIPNTFTIKKNVNYFDSSLDDNLYFNPKQSVGVGTTAGATISVTYKTGSKNKVISVPTQSIYLPNHPFKTNQVVTLRKLSSLSALTVSNSSGGSTFSLPLSGDEQTVYIINKSADYIGIVTQVGLTTTTNGLFFTNNGSDDFRYLIKTNYKQSFGDVKKVTTQVSLSTSHGLTDGDIINLSVKPNLSVGVGQSSSVKLKYDVNRQKLIINPRSFTSPSISTVTGEITVSNHGFETSDKVIYNASTVAVGLTQGIYYIFKVDNDTIKLCETQKDSISDPPLTVGITSAPSSSHYLNPINPALVATKGNTLLFDLSDSSLLGYNLKLFYDDKFEKEFISTGISTVFSITGVGTVGVSTNASLSLKYDDSLNAPLFYTLEKSGYISTSDTEVKNYSQITFVDSLYNNSYKITGIGTTTFAISINVLPEKTSYTKSDCSVLKYTTSSTTALGPISKIKTVSAGFNYKKLPIFKEVESATGNNAYIVPESNSVGKIGEVTILNNGFEYSSDKTLRPEALISKVSTIKDAFSISEVSVIDGGKNYISTPNLIIFNTQTGEKIESGLLRPVVSGSSIISVDVEQPPKGIPDVDVELRTINNSNGVRIESVQSSSGIVTCTLVTPLSGFSNEPFTVGDTIFVEGIQKYDSSGDGFNSEDYSYTFFKVEQYLNAGTLLPRKLTYSGVSTNPGIAKTVQDFYGTVVNYKNYPKFSLSKTISNFTIGENLDINTGLGFERQDLVVIESNKNYIKTSGLYELKVNDVVRGSQSGTIATINDVKDFYGYFTVGYASTQKIGWENNVGKLDEDLQVIADNDYYQNLSYSVKSKQQWEEIVSPVNNLLHPSGFKNFADTEISQNVNVGIATTVKEYANVLYKFVTENRVDTINNFDLVVDIDTIEDTSVFLKLKNKKLANYIQCNTNRVLEIDDISSEFNIEDVNDGFELEYNNIPIFMKTFNPSSSSVLDTSTGKFSINNHFFQTGEQLIYRPKTSVGSAGTAIGIGTTLSYTGVSTNILPSIVYAIRIDNDNFKIATRREYAVATIPIPITITNVGYGSSHEFEMVKKNEKSIITINNVVQSPIAYSLLNYTTNSPSSIGTATSIFALSGISSISLNDILKVDSEYMKVINVGVGTSSSGPISFAGTFPLVQVQRAFVGSSATTHSGVSSVTLYRGSFNIERNRIYFVDSLMSTLDDETFSADSNLSVYNSDFHGRVFLRKDYTTNQVFDDISEKFTGIGQTYTITVGGANTVGLGTTAGNGIVFINGIFQTPLTQNNNLDVGSNYSIIENLNVGVSSIVFTGLKLPSGAPSITDYDVNMNQLPRGGLIVSLGSTPGLGYAPLVGASVTAIVGAGGSIVAIGIGTTGNWGSGYRNPVSIAISEYGHSGSISTITANVGAGGTLSFNIVYGGTGYVNPRITISPPNYSNLPITGVSRLGIGSTTSSGFGLLLNVEVGSSSTTGIGSTLFQVTNFGIARNGYGFKKGDVIKAVGLVTDAYLPNPISEFQLTILETFTDSFSGWQFGQIDYIDNIKNYQDGVRTRFPLYYNSNLLSFERNDFDIESQLIDFNALLIIFVNGILQQPGVAYQFDGGTTFTFSEPPESQDNISIFFYRGSLSDSSQVNVVETIKPGDDVQVFLNNNYLGITTTQEPRVVTEIPSSDKIQTNTYNLDGIDTQIYKPLSWTKQKVDKVIGGNFVSKSRDSIESQIYPTAKIIKNFSTADNELFVDNAKFFDYESAAQIKFDALIVSGVGTVDPVSASVLANVSVASTISSITILNGGSGYTPNSTFAISISKPIGIGTTATATATASSAGVITSINITNPGSGYTSTRLPQVLVPLPDIIYEEIDDASVVEGFAGYITGIQTVAGIGTNLALRFTLNSLTGFSGLATGYPIYISNTSVGKGVTSIIDQNTNVVGVGTTFLDNIYYINAFNASVGIITCNIHSQTNTVGIATTGAFVGSFSWGRIAGFSRPSPVAIAVSGYSVDVGLTTFPTIQRRGYGLRSIGPIKKVL